MASLVRLATIARRHLLRDHGHRREKARRSPARDGEVPPRERKSGALRFTFVATKRTSGHEQEI